jgi:hypothetical protein
MLSEVSIESEGSTMFQRTMETTRLCLALAPLVLTFACGTEPAPASHTSVRINELCSSNHNYQDETGDTDDWIELINLGDAAIDLAGYYISDTANNRLKVQIGTGNTLAPGGILLLWADSQQQQGANHLAFKFSSSGDGACVSNPQGYVLDCIRFSAIPLNDAGEDASLARFPDGIGAFQWCSQSSPEEPNGTSCGGSPL